jgi:YD repeat-containing protein
MYSKETIREYDSNGREIYARYINGYERWYEYSPNGNRIHYKDSNGREWWYEYDSKGKLIHYKNNRGIDNWYWEGKETKDLVKILLLASQIHSKV